MRSSAPATSKRTKNDCQGGERANSNQHPKIRRHRFLQNYRLGISPGRLGIWFHRLGQAERGQKELGLRHVALDDLERSRLLTFFDLTFAVSPFGPSNESLGDWYAAHA